MSLDNRFIPIPAPNLPNGEHLQGVLVLDPSNLYNTAALSSATDPLSGESLTSQAVWVVGDVAFHIHFSSDGTDATTSNGAYIPGNFPVVLAVPEGKKRVSLINNSDSGQVQLYEIK